MFCTKCGIQIKDGYKFCPKCGTPVYVEKEMTKSEVKKEEVDEVTKGANISLETEPVVKSTERVKKTTKVKKNAKASSSINKDFVPNPLIEKELDIEQWKVMAAKGDEYAILVLAFRYEMGIGIDKDVEKAKELYSRANKRYIICDTLKCDIITRHLCVTKKQSEQFFKDRS